MATYDSPTHHILFGDPFWAEDSDDHDTSGEATPRPDRQWHSTNKENIAPMAYPSPDFKSKETPRRPFRGESEDQAALKEAFDMIAQYPRLWAPPNVIPPPPEALVSPVPRRPGSPDLIYEELRELNRVPKCKGVPRQSTPLILKLDEHNRFKCPACKVIFTLFSDVVIHTVNWGEKSAETIAELTKLASVKDGEKRRKSVGSPTKISLPSKIARI